MCQASARIAETLSLKKVQKKKNIAANNNSMRTNKRKKTIIMPSKIKIYE